MLKALTLKSIILIGLAFVRSICLADVTFNEPVSFSAKIRKAEVLIEGEILRVRDLTYSLKGEEILCGSIYTIAVKRRYKGAITGVLELSAPRPIYESPTVAPAIGDHVLVLAKRLHTGESWYSKGASAQANRCRSDLGEVVLSETTESVFQIIRYEPAAADVLLYSKIRTKWPSTEEGSVKSCADDPRTIGRRCIIWRRVQEMLHHHALED